jgi:hypothetical protein
MPTTEPGFWQGIFDVTSGRGQLRLILQPLVATIVGLRLGITDAKLGKDPFLMRLAFTGTNRGELVTDALRTLVFPFSVAIVLDCVLQYLMFNHVRPLAALIVGTVLIWIPFSISRSFTNRIYRRRHPLRSHPAST